MQFQVARWNELDDHGRYIERLLPKLKSIEMKALYSLAVM
jgi:hypothetical protein